MKYPSKLVEDAVDEIAKLPGIGRKSALRLALFLLKQDEQSTLSLAQALVKMRTQIGYCQSCHNISDAAVCAICANTGRDQSMICVVEDTPDVLAIENTGQYNGLYHVLGGVISPMEGVSPSHLHIESLIGRAAQEGVKEVILALSATMEGDTTAFYITKRLKQFEQVKVSTLARGVPVGGELEYTDEVTLGRSIIARTKLE